MSYKVIITISARASDMPTLMWLMRKLVDLMGSHPVRTRVLHVRVRFEREDDMCDTG